MTSFFCETTWACAMKVKFNFPFKFLWSQWLDESKHLQTQCAKLIQWGVIDSETLGILLIRTTLLVASCRHESKHTQKWETAAAAGVEPPAHLECLRQSLLRQSWRKEQDRSNWTQSRITLKQNADWFDV